MLNATLCAQHTRRYNAAFNVTVSVTNNNNNFFFLFFCVPITLEEI